MPQWSIIPSDLILVWNGDAVVRWDIVEQRTKSLGVFDFNDVSKVWAEVELDAHQSHEKWSLIFRNVDTGQEYNSSIFPDFGAGAFPLQVYGKVPDGQYEVFIVSHAGQGVNSVHLKRLSYQRK